MPTILNPRDTDRHNRLEDHDNGSGRRPPVDKHTGGGGSGDNENWDHRHQPRSRLIRCRMGIFSALAGDMIFFGVVVLAFLVNRSTVALDQHTNTFARAWHTLTLPRILWLNTVLLILSSITMEGARRQMFHEIDVMEEWLGLGKPTTRRTIPWLIATIVLGLGFLAGQWRAWYQISLQPAIYKANQSSQFFHVITGIHAAHLILGVGALFVVIIALRRSKQMESRQIFVDAMSWYWHSMGIFWLFLFSVLLIFR